MPTTSNEMGKKVAKTLNKPAALNGETGEVTEKITPTAEKSNRKRANADKSNAKSAKAAKEGFQNVILFSK